MTPFSWFLLIVALGVAVWIADLFGIGGLVLVLGICGLLYLSARAITWE